MKKTSWFVMFVIVFLMAFPQNGFAASKTGIVLDGKNLNLPKDVEVQNIKGNIMIPIRVVVEELGFEVNWVKNTRTVTIKQEGTTLQLVIDKKIAKVNSKNVTLPLAPMISNGTTLVPLRFVSEQMGLGIKWDNNAKVVYLTSPKVENPDSNQDLATVNGIQFINNQLNIEVSKKVKPSIFKMTAPDRIVVDLPNSTFADNFSANQVLDANNTGYIDIVDHMNVNKIRYAMFSQDPSTVRVVIDMNGASNYTITTNNDNLVAITLSDDTSLPVNNGKKLVVIDAGHGGSDPGAISVKKRNEKDFNLAVALKVEALLKKESEIEYVMTRDRDVYPTLQDRVDLANRIGATIFISIHANSSTSSAANGVETYYTRPESLPLANVVHKYLVSSTGSVDRQVRIKSLKVTRETQMPAVLIEAGYLSNATEEAKLYTEQFQNNLAAGIVASIKEYLDVK
ncbi:N-acetylmuramoyl-L-alanine amidase family protein [Paenibacillus turicensis]|uniref:N-acetylmuramoyl-L-alanine amidase n=1 Tax=Paenibacillus turicensis TaxID=160487 RepID=UPI003D2DE41A